MMKSENHKIELVARMVARNDVCDESLRSPTLREVVDEQHVKCGILLTQPSQETQDDTTEEPLFIASIEIVEHLCRSVGVGDVLPDTGFISGVDPQPISLDVDPFFMQPEFMSEYEAVDDRPVPKLSKRDKPLLQRALAEHDPEIPDCPDLSQTHRVVLDGLRFDDSVPLINHDNVIVWKVLYFRPWRR
jgi:hypothetical protein